MYCICTGGTRYVLLTKTYAIKVPRLNLRKLIQAIIKRVFSRTMSQGPQRTVNLKAASRSVLALLCAGLEANRQENAIWNQHPELPIAPVIGMYLGGAVLVMQRGKELPVSRSVALAKRFPSLGDLEKPEHACGFPGGKIRFIDYGHPDVPSAFGL